MPGASALIKAMCDELGVAPLIDERVRWDQQCKLLPGTRIVPMIVSVLVHPRLPYRRTRLANHPARSMPATACHGCRPAISEQADQPPFGP